MNILMVHGIGQEGNTQQTLKKTWLDCIHKVAPELLDNIPVEMAYYGNTLAEWALKKPNNAIAMGTTGLFINAGDQNEVNFLTAVLEEAISNQGIDKSEIQKAQIELGTGKVIMGNVFADKLVTLVRVLEKFSPKLVSTLLELVRQSHTYLNSPGAGAAVDSIVKPLIQNSPQILITHSLGTLITFKLLRELEKEKVDIEIPLLITMGSPLAINEFKKKLGAPLRKPASVGRWVNFYDTSDIVTFGKPLDAINFTSGIENDGTVNNRTYNFHGVIGYLPHKQVIQELKAMLNL